MTYQLHLGDSREVLQSLADCSIDSVVTDPPAGIAFMGRNWDGDKGGRDSWIAWMQEIASEALRVAKPGAHALVWALPRTAHWTATAWEIAGWEVRDRIAHLFGSGFPKSHNALKPAMEDWWLLRKPLAAPSIAANVAAHGTGALNIDGCRVGMSDADREFILKRTRPNTAGQAHTGEVMNRPATPTVNVHVAGRWPSNCLHDGSDEVMEAFAAFGIKPSTGDHPSKSEGTGNGVTYLPKKPQGRLYSDTGTAARFFYCAKASKADRGEGNRHPTVKPTALMRYLVRLVTPPGGVVLDPFMGSGSTGKAALLEGFRFVGIEREAEYHEIAERRIKAALLPLFIAAE